MKSMKIDIYSFMFGALLTIMSAALGAAIALIFAVVV